jgi:hypothetical protein
LGRKKAVPTVAVPKLEIKRKAAAIWMLLRRSGKSIS